MVPQISGALALGLLLKSAENEFEGQIWRPVGSARKKEHWICIV